MAIVKISDLTSKSIVDENDAFVVVDTGAGDNKQVSFDPFHLRRNSGGGSVNASAALVLEHNSTNYIQFLGSNNNTQGIIFGDTSDNDAGRITYSHGTNEMQFVANAVTRLEIDGATGYVGIGELNPDIRLHVTEENDLRTSTTGGVVKLENRTRNSGSSQILNLNYSFVSANRTSGDYWIAFYRGTSIVGSINSEVVYSNFTGGHPSAFPVNAKRGEVNLGSSSMPPLTGSEYSPGDPEIAQGMVVVATGENCFTASIDNSSPRVVVATSSMNPAAFGVYNGYHTSDLVWCSGSDMYMYNAVGEGGILVTDISGNISAGDLLVTSERYGHAIKQPDDIVRNYTVAKATQDVDFSTIPTSSQYGFKSALIGCTYMCG